MSLLDKAITTYVTTAEEVTVGDGLTLIVVDNAKVSLEPPYAERHVGGVRGGRN